MPTMGLSRETLTYLSTMTMPLLMAAGAIVGMFASFRVAVGAYRDIIRLDRGESSLQEMMLRPMLERFTPTRDSEVKELRKRLIMGGLRDDGAITRFTMLKLWSMGASLAVVPLALVAGVSAFSTLLVSVFAFLLALMFPDWYLNKKIASRQDKISRALPSATDLMVLCLDVGLSVEASFERVTLEMRSFEPLMAEESQQMVGEIAAGVSFPQALKRMAERIGLEELLTLSRLISQASQLGASVATALREYSESANQKRVLGLEERAGKISSLMVLPITLCMLPATMIALVGPAVLMLIKAFSKV